MNKELVHENANPDVKDYFYKVVLNLPYDILEKLADPFQSEVVTNDKIMTGHSTLF